MILPVFADSPSFTDPVTYLGSKMLPRADLVVLGSVAESHRLGTAATTGRFTVTEVLAGSEARKAILLLAADASLLPGKRTECVLFLRRLGEGRYEPVGRVELFGASRDGKLETLRAYLRIEAMKDGKVKRKTLHDLLMKNLASDDPFLFFSAARELANFTKKNGEHFTDADARAMQKRAARTSNAVLKELLAAALQNLGKKLEVDTDPAAGESGKPRTPPSVEFKELAAAWRKGKLRAEARTALVRELCTRHLRHAGQILLEALEDEDAEVRELAARNLGEAEVGAARQPLTRLLTREKSRAVRRAAVRSLGILRAKDALPAILELGRDPELLRPVAFAAARIGGTEAREFLEGLRRTHSGASKHEETVRKLVDFLLSDEFAAQEEAMRKIRRKRLK
jgi:HEAT repeat protein